MNNRIIKFRAWDGKYFLDSQGNVFSSDFNHTGSIGMLKQYLDKDGYPYVVLVHAGKRTKLVVHRAIAKLFLGEKPTEKHQVNHKNGKRNDNRVKNLEWVTSRENTLHGWRVNGRKQSLKARLLASERMKEINKHKYSNPELLKP